jgi:GT2 family glycosyltransferase
MKLSVIIVNHNTCSLLKQSLNSLIKAANEAHHELIVVDNASTDNSLKMLRTEFPQVSVIANESNLGLAKANNQAVQLATGDYILLINPDTISSKDTLDKTIDFMNTHPLTGGLSVRMITPQGLFLPESIRGLSKSWINFFKFTGLSKLFPKSRLYNRSRQDWVEEFETTEIDVLNSSFMLLRKSALNFTGLFDEKFFGFGYNIDLSYRLRQAGFKNYYFPKTYIMHFRAQNPQKFSWQYIKNFYGAMIIFAIKYLFKLPALPVKGVGQLYPSAYEVER